MRYRFLLVAIFATFCFAVSSSHAASIAPEHIQVPILVYHHIRDAKPYPKSTWSYKMSVSPLVFERQMQWISDHGFTPVTLDHAVAILRKEKTDPIKPVVITFDDNNLNAYDLGVPVLQKHGFVAVFYVITNRLKNSATIDEPRVKKLSEMGMDVQSHSVTHSIMTNLSMKKLDQELSDSKKTLEAITGKPVRHIAYPLSSQNKIIRARAAALGYITGTIMDPRVATEKDDLLKLPRIMMTDDTKLEKVLR